MIQTYSEALATKWDEGRAEGRAEGRLQAARRATASAPEARARCASLGQAAADRGSGVRRPWSGRPQSSRTVRKPWAGASARGPRLAA